jgi:hypothetical protein
MIYSSKHCMPHKHAPSIRREIWSSPPDPTNHRSSTTDYSSLEKNRNNHRHLLTNIFNATTNLHSLPRPPPRPTPPNRLARPLPRLLPPPLHPRTLQRVILPSFLGRTPSLRNSIRPHPRPGIASRLQCQSNRVRLSAARKSFLLSCRSAAPA